MLKQERIRLMEEYIAQKGFASMEDLCSTFSISINTARADVRDLVKAGRARKAYGGVSYEQIAQYPSYECRELEHTEIKSTLARAAAQLVRNGDILFIDVGTTCLPILDYIPADYSITVISNDLATINKAAVRPNTAIMTFGGTYQHKSNSFKCTFPALHSYINTCNISKAFLGATGISSTGALTNSENFGRELRSALLHSCPACYLLADSSKFGKAALLTYGNLGDLVACITDSGVPDSYRTLCQASGTELVLADRL